MIVVVTGVKIAVTVFIQHRINMPTAHTQNYHNVVKMKAGDIFDVIDDYSTYYFIKLIIYFGQS